jgi:hypothetical protein
MRTVEYGCCSWFPGVRPPGRAETTPPVEPTQLWQHAAVLAARAQRLEVQMREEPESAQYGLCQVYWASQATQDERALLDLVFKTKAPTRWAWEQAGIELTIPFGDDSCPTP